MQYNIKQITQTYLSMCSTDGRSYINQFPKDVRAQVGIELLTITSKNLKNMSKKSSDLELSCSEHGCLESHF